MPDVCVQQDHRIDPTALAEQLYRRREASWRLPPLQDGRRDPASEIVG